MPVAAAAIAGANRAKRRSQQGGASHGIASGSASGQGETFEETLEKMMGAGGEEDKPPTYERFSDQPFFVIIIAVAISVNAVQMGMELQFSQGAWKTLWKVIENFFTAFFLGEMTVKFWKDGVGDYFGQKANIMDFVIVMCAIVDNWVLSIFMSDEEKEKLSFLSVIKLVRLGRILKLLKMKRQLKLLVESIVNSLGAMAWLSVLLAILIYMLAICTVQFIGTADMYPKKEFDNKKHFGDMVSASVSALNLALLDGFGDTVRAIVKYQPMYAVAILIYVAVSSFGIMNSIIGVIVTKTSEATEQLEQETEDTYRKAQMAFVNDLTTIIYEIDEDGDGTVSPEEIEAASDNKELLQCLEKIDLPFGFKLIDLHTMLDQDGDGELTKMEFFVGMRRLIFSNDLQRQCLLSLSMAQSKRKLWELRVEMEDRFTSVSSKLDSLLANAGVAQPSCSPPPGDPKSRVIDAGEDGDEPFEHVLEVGGECSTTNLRHSLPYTLIDTTAFEAAQGVTSACDSDNRQSTEDCGHREPTAPRAVSASTIVRPGSAASTNCTVASNFDQISLLGDDLRALHDKLDSLDLNIRVQNEAIVAQPAPLSPGFDAYDQIALLGDGVLAMNRKFDDLKFSDQIMQMEKYFKSMNQNMQWLRGAIQTNVVNKPDGVANSFGGMDVPSKGPYTIAVTGASLIIQTPNVPTFSQPNTTPLQERPALPGGANEQQAPIHQIALDNQIEMHAPLVGPGRRVAPAPAQVQQQMRRPASAGSLRSMNMFSG